MTDKEVKSLSLTQKLFAHLQVADEDAVAQQMASSTKDPVRSFRSQRIRTHIYARDNGQCFHCEQFVEYEEMEVDHVIPWSRGGQTNEYNGVCSCRPCNRQKSARIW